MKKIILASVSGIALMGLAACNDADNVDMQGVDTAPVTTTDPAAAPADTMAPADDPAAPVDPVQ